ncbi:MAG: hypothetical protein AVDCRST_MAG25-3179, partial [uncultured Rubrobacteraceae bacterium]
DGLLVSHAGHGARAPLDGQDAAPAGGARLGAAVPDDVLLHKREWIECGLAAAGVSDGLLPGLRVRVSARAGIAFRGHHGRQRPRPRHRERLLRPALPHPDASRRTPERDARRRGGAGSYPGRRVSALRALDGCEHQQRLSRDARDRGAHGASGPRLRRPRGCARDTDRVGGGGRERLSAVLRGYLYVLDQPPERPHRAGLVPVYSHDQPHLLPRRGHPEFGDHGLGPPGAPAGLLL